MGGACTNQEKKNISKFGRTERCFCYTRPAMLSPIDSMYRCCLAGHIVRVLGKVLAEGSEGPAVVGWTGSDEDGAVN
jgi:hypothetical protein